MVEDDPQYLTDRSTAGKDDRCGMSRWWYKHEGGVGIVPAWEPAALRVGKDTHEDLSAVAEAEDIRPVKLGEMAESILAGRVAETQAEREELWRRAGWLVAYGLYVEPTVREKYETVSIEAEHILDRNPLWIAYTPDRYLRHKEGNYLVYREYKSTISASNKWITSWPFAIQIHIGLAGMEEELGEKPAFAQVMGLMKGDYRDHRLSHPYVWAYKNESTGEWTHDYNKARSAQWDHYPVWEYPGGILEWVQRCGPEVGRNQFPHTPPIFYNERLLDDWVVRRIAREEEVAAVVDLCRADWGRRIIYFEPRYDQCRPPFGDACSYALACHNAAVRENPLASPEYVRRTPHHEVEVQWMNWIRKDTK